MIWLGLLIAWGIKCTYGACFDTSKYGTVNINQLHSSGPKYIPKVALSEKSWHFPYPVAITVRFLCQRHRSMHFQTFEKTFASYAARKNPPTSLANSGCHIHLHHPSSSSSPSSSCTLPSGYLTPTVLSKSFWILFSPKRNHIKKVSHGTFSRVAARRAAEPATPGRRLSPGMWWQ